VAELLLEIGSEEIPSRFIELAINSLTEGLSSELRKRGLLFKELQKFGTPRRICIAVLGLSGTSLPKKETIGGPPASIGLDVK